MGRRQKYKEGLYQDEEGKNVAYFDRISDQEEIRKFLEDIFQAKHAGCDGKRLNWKQFEYINKTISSEMFYSLMAILHERLPCSKNFFRMKKTFRDREGAECSSPVRTIASPKMIRGLSITKTQNM